MRLSSSGFKYWQCTTGILCVVLVVLVFHFSYYGSPSKQAVVPPIKHVPNTKRSPAASLIRQLVLISEFGVSKKIPGHRTISRYMGETVIDNGSLVAKVHQMIAGRQLLGYVFAVTNMLDEPLELSRAMFRMDDTKTISASRWALAPRPVNAEQQLTGAHRAFDYVVTRGVTS